MSKTWWYRISVWIFNDVKHIEKIFVCIQRKNRLVNTKRENGTTWLCCCWKNFVLYFLSITKADNFCSCKAFGYYHTYRMIFCINHGSSLWKVCICSPKCTIWNMYTEMTVIEMYESYRARITQCLNLKTISSAPQDDELTSINS